MFESSDIFRRFEHDLSDTHGRLIAREMRFDNVVVIDVDEDSITKLQPTLGAWPYERDIYALVTQWLLQAGVRAVAYDIVFAEPRKGDDAFAAVLDQRVLVPWWMRRKRLPTLSHCWARRKPASSPACWNARCCASRFPLPAVAGAKSYRAQIARDKEFTAMVADTISASAELRFTDVPDGAYVLRVRAIDPRGLEGKDATHEFRLKARPEPPLVSAPPPKGKVRSAAVEFKWADNPEAAVYHLQIARDAGFKSVVHENKAAKGTTATVAKLPLGDYFWRVASLRKDDDRGPYGDVASFVLMVPPAPPTVGDDAMQFRWAGEPGQKFDFQMANNAQFTKPLLTRTLDKPELDIPRPGPGTYYMRFRTTDPDGFVGPFSSSQRFSMPACITDSTGRCIVTNFGIVGPSQ